MRDQQLIVDGPSAGASPKDGSTTRVVFSLGKEVFSINADSVSEIIHPLPLTPLPNCPTSIDGVSVLRGEVIAVLNIRSIVKTNAERSSAPVRCKWIVLSASAGSCRFAFPVDKLVEIASDGHANGNKPESRPKPAFPELDINAILSELESELH